MILFGHYLFKSSCNVLICNVLQNAIEVLPANKKVGFVFKGNCTKLTVDLNGMKFRCCLNMLKKQTRRP